MQQWWRQEPSSWAQRLAYMLCGAAVAAGAWTGFLLAEPNGVIGLFAGGLAVGIPVYIILKWFMTKQEKTR